MRRKYTPKFKAKVLGKFNAGEDVNELAKKYKIHTSQIYSWRKAAGGATQENKSNGVNKELYYCIRRAEKELMDGIRAGEITKVRGDRLSIFMACEAMEKEHAKN